jgi:ubiquitin C-terminal hydrolase
MKILRPAPQTPGDHLVIRALQAWQKEFTKEYSPFVDIFYGLGHWQTECQKCKTVTHRWESFNSLKVSIPKGEFGAAPVKLHNLLQTEMESEVIENYECDTCKLKTTVKRWYRLWRLPHTLIIVFKRFNFDGQKIHTRIEPLENAQIDFAPYFSEYSPEKGGVTSYTLRSIVDHHGSSLGGHYTAQVKQRGAEEWYLYDDEGVIHMNGKGPLYGDSTYMLFLERNTGSAPVAQEA